MIDLLIQSKLSKIADNFTVRRALPTIQRRMVGPFIFFDHMGPVDFEIGN
jgi:redox-sensitive bicupin YhaK (pirin superfamily)